MPERRRRRRAIDRRKMQGNRQDMNFSPEGQEYHFQMNTGIVRRKNWIEELAIAWMIINTAALHDYTASLIVSEVIAFAVVATNALLLKRKVPRYFLYYLLWIGSFTLLCFVSYIWSVARQTHWSMMLSMLQIVLVGSTTLLYIGGGDEAESERRTATLFTLLLIAAFTLCVRLGVSVPVSAWGTERIGRYIGLGNTGVTYMLSYPSLIALYRALQDRKKWYYYLLYVLYNAFSMMSGARKGVLIMILGTIILFVCTAKSRQSAIKRLVASLLISGAVLYAVMNVSMLYNGIGVRLQTMMQQFLTNSGDDSINTRLQLLEYAEKAFIQRPILGAGLDAFRHINPLNTYAHNNLMEILACLGIPGALLFYSLPVLNLFSLWARMRAKQKDSAMYFALIVCIVACDFFTIWYYNENIQIYIALLFSVPYWQTLKKRKAYVVQDMEAEREDA